MSCGVCWIRTRACVSAVLEIYRIEDEASLKNVISLLGDESEESPGWPGRRSGLPNYQNSLRLVKSLSLPRKKVRASFLDLLEEMAIKDLDVFRFVQFQARTCYQMIVQAQGVRRLSDGDLQQLLAVHLDERVWSALQTTLQVLGARGPFGPYAPLARGILSNDKRQRANGLEAMDNILDKQPRPSAHAAIWKIWMSARGSPPASGCFPPTSKNYRQPRFSKICWRAATG